MTSINLRLELLGQTCNERVCCATGNEMQEGLVHEETERPERRYVATTENHIARRDRKLAGEDREQRGEARRPPGDLDEHLIADRSGGPNVDEDSLSNGSRRAAVKDRKVEVGRNLPQLRGSSPSSWCNSASSARLISQLAMRSAGLTSSATGPASILAIDSGRK
jgi:hypothetical protein